jgi:ankyrin repeat protein
MNRKINKLIIGFFLVSGLLFQGAFFAFAGELIDAVRQNDIAGVSEILAKGTDPDECDENKKTALMWALENDRDDISKQLIEKGADVDANYSYGMSILMSSINRGRVQMAKYLI